MYLLRVVAKPKHLSHFPKPWIKVTDVIVVAVLKDGPYWFANLKRQKYILHITLTNLVTSEISCYSSTQ